MSGRGGLVTNWGIAAAWCVSSPARADDLDRTEPLIRQLVATVNALERKELQVIGLSLHRMGPDVSHSTATFEVQPGRVALHLALDGRITGGIDAVVRAPDGRVLASDDNGERDLALEFEATTSGAHTLDLDVVRNRDESDQPTYLVLVHGVPSDGDVVSALSVLDTAAAVVKYSDEDLGYRFVTLSMSALFDAEPDAVMVRIPQATYADCLSVVAGTAQRTRKLEMRVTDANLTSFTKSDRIGRAMRIARFVNDERDARHFFEISARTRRRLGDTHVVLLVACRPPQ